MLLKFVMQELSLDAVLIVSMPSKPMIVTEEIETQQPVVLKNFTSKMKEKQMIQKKLTNIELLLEVH